MKLKPNCFFIDGPGGTGKTYLFKVNTKYLKTRTKSQNYFEIIFQGIEARCKRIEL